MFRPIYRPSSGVIYKNNILKKLLTFNGSVDLIIPTLYYAPCANCFVSILNIIIRLGNIYFFNILYLQITPEDGL
jgi:hypothetical protein